MSTHGRCSLIGALVIIMCHSLNFGLTGGRLLRIPFADSLLFGFCVGALVSKLVANHWGG